MDYRRFVTVMCVLTAFFSALAIFTSFYTSPPYGGNAPVFIETARSTVSDTAGSMQAVGAASDAGGKATSASKASEIVKNSEKNALTASSEVAITININTATAEELDKLPEIGPVLANEIVSYRNTHGSFKTIEELDNVKGIGEGIINKIRNMITV